MTEEMTGPQIPILLTGPLPRSGVWCFCCATLFAAAHSNDPTVQKFVKQQHENIVKHGGKVHIFEMPEREDAQLQLAVTIGPSVFFDIPLPVCWTHIQPYSKPSGEQVHRGPSLVPGKAYGSEWKDQR